MNSRLSTVAFTGYRASKITSAVESYGGLEWLEERLQSVVEELIMQGYTTFISGMSDGFDMIAASVVLRLRADNPAVELMAVVPFRGQEYGYSAEDKVLYDNILAEADRVHYMANEYLGKGQYLERNNFLVDNASHIVCFFDGRRGGTMYTYNRAQRRGLDITNLAHYGAYQGRLF